MLPVGEGLIGDGQGKLAGFTLGAHNAVVVVPAAGFETKTQILDDHDMSRSIRVGWGEAPPIKSGELRPTD